MRFAILSALFASTLAAPVLVERQEAGPKYHLQIKSENPKLADQFLSSRSGSVGVFGSKDTFFTSKYGDAATLSIHTVDLSHQLALRGTNGLLDLVDVINPTAESIPRGQSMEWSTFVIDPSGNVVIKDGQNIPTRTWVAYANTDGSSGIALYDGVTVPQTRQLTKIQLIAVPAAPGGSTAPAVPAAPGGSTAPAVPAVPAVPGGSTVPAVPAVPAVPGGVTKPAVPAVPGKAIKPAPSGSVTKPDATKEKTKPNATVAKTKSAAVAAAGLPAAPGA